MFWRTSTGYRCSIIAYAPRGESEIHFRYAYGGREREDADEIQFVDTESRDRFLAALDSGRGPHVIDANEITGVRK